MNIEKSKQLWKLPGFEIVSFLGSGTYANCYLVKNKQYKDQLFVVKQFKKGVMKDNDIEASFKRELDMLVLITHPHIVKLYEYFDFDDEKDLILEYCSNGSLSEAILNEKVDQYRNIQFISQIVSALEYLHANNIAHMDIKPSNILIDMFGRPKLADFGLAFDWDGKKYVRSYTGTSAYMAPEIIGGKEYDPLKADIWSLGATIYHMYTEDIPWKNLSYKQMKLVMPNGVESFHQKFPPEIREILNGCLKLDPDQRLTINEIRNLINPIRKLMHNKGGVLFRNISCDRASIIGRRCKIIKPRSKSKNILTSSF